MSSNTNFILDIIKDMEDEFRGGFVEPDMVELVALRDYGFTMPVKPLIQTLSETNKVKLLFMEDASTPLIKVVKDE